MRCHVDLKVEGTSGKHILKRALEEILPTDLLYERKRGFGAPVREWFRGPNAGELLQLIMNSRFAAEISLITNSSSSWRTSISANARTGAPIFGRC